MTYTLNWPDESSIKRDHLCLWKDSCDGCVSDP